MITKRGRRTSGSGQVNLPLPVVWRCREENKDEGKNMSKNENRRSKLITALGLVGLMLGLSAPMVSAQVATFTSAN